MSVLSKDMETTLKNGSLIRKMFETGAQLKAQYGVDKVCDFSLGNPDLAPPASVLEALKELANDTCTKPASLGYMPNSGFAFARKTLADYLSKEQNISLTEDDLILTCGAAGGMQVFFRTVLDSEDEVLGISPFFVDYFKYISCNNGVFRPVPAQEKSFLPDIKALEAAINSKTRALVINSPNNPTGVIYSKEVIQELIELVENASKKYGRTVYLVADEPYRFLAYDVEVPSVLDMSANCVILGSFSKNLALAGERIGYIALSPLLEQRATLMAGLVQANRFLGFVNAPIIGQYLMHAALQAENLDKTLADAKEIYHKRRDRLAQILTDAGISFNLPQGAFYFFIQSPTQDEDIFVETLKKELILAVPGRGFGLPGYVRLSFAVTDSTIENSAEGFKKAMKSLLS